MKILLISLEYEAGWETTLGVIMAKFWRMALFQSLKYLDLSALKKKSNILWKTMVLLFNLAFAVFAFAAFNTLQNTTRC